ncbi:MAG: hypothetical protein FWG02_11235 [Holophagaceae bacterium]|nr:hypothetical protein [Holophagaceae bacterium]
MNEALSHLFAYNVVTNLSRSQPDFTWTFINNHIHNLDAHDPNKQEEITGPFREYAIARTMWRIQKNVFNRDFDKIIKIWRSLKEVDLVHVYSWQKKAQEHVSNMSIHIQEEMERGGMFNDRGSQKIHFNYRVNTLVADVPYRAYGLVSADSGRPIWRNNSVIYYNVNQTTKKRLTRMSINCEPNTRYKIDFIGANGFIQKTDAIRGSKNNIALPSNRVSYTIRIRIERIRPQFIPDPEEIQMTATFK